ncbi:unnamed protein product [Lactuca virosa]|uniref:Peptidase M24 domain-containing protein n=1 Tax=Lactuca virosa TaxID=75947 RepID=A0AAU9PCP9_9ASTR|nr:unnamed protein product [Lactuca virosa]
MMVTDVSCCWPSTTCEGAAVGDQWLAGGGLDQSGALVGPSVTTTEIDKVVHQLIIENCAYPSTLGYGGFPKSVCTSVNECMCHGIPDSGQLQDGDTINSDVTVYLNVLSLLTPYEGKIVLELAARISRFTGALVKKAGKVIALDFIECVVKNVCKNFTLESCICYLHKYWAKSKINYVHTDENRALSEKKQKKIVNTPAQVAALDNFYNGHLPHWAANSTRPLSESNCWIGMLHQLKIKARAPLEKGHKRKE